MGSPAAAEKCFHAGDQLHDTKRFCHIIIRSDIQTFYFINLCRFSCDQDNRLHISLFIQLQLFHDLQTVFIRQHDIQKKQIRNLLLQPFIKVLCAIKFLCLISGIFQCIAFDLRYIPVILYNIYERHRNRLPFAYGNIYFSFSFLKLISNSSLFSMSSLYS